MLRLRTLSLIAGGLCAGVLLSGARVAAQSPTTGSLTATLVDTAGAPLEGVEATLRDAGAGFARSATSSAAGEVTFTLLLPGDYELFAEQLGHRPARLRGVSVFAGRGVRVRLPLRPASGVVAEADETRFNAGAAGLGTGFESHYASAAIDLFPAAGRELSEVARLSSEVGPEMESQGLPGYLSSLLVNGLPAGGGMHPRARSGVLRGAALPLSGFGQAELVANGVDVEWNGPGLILNGEMRRGGRSAGMGAFGDWAAPGLSSATGGAPDARGGVWLAGPIIADTLSFIVGAEVWSLASRLPGSTGTDSTLARVARVADELYGAVLGDPAGSARSSGSVVSAFGRFDWRVAASHLLTLHGTFASLASAPLGGRQLRWAARGSVDGVDGGGGLALLSHLTPRLSQEMRLGWESSRREEAGDTREVPASTRFLEGELAFGGDPTLAGRFRQTTLRVSETVHVRLGSHAAKVGLSAALATLDQTDRYGRAGEFLFAGPAEFARGEGSFRQTIGAAATTVHEVPRVAAYLQDRWMATPGLELLLGLRYDVEKLPLERLAYDETWLARTGLPDTVLSPVRGHLSPRIGFVWDLRDEHRWIVHGSAGLFSGPVDPSILGELRVVNEEPEVRRGFGVLGSWPAAPARDAPVVGPTLTLAAPGLKGPRTARGSAGIGGRLGLTAVHLGVLYRRTDFLPRRSDLNLMPAPVQEDQYGRAVFGRLRQQGALLGAENGSNRRFADFDVVSAINVDGWSQHRAVTVALERPASDWLTLLASYTRSVTRDNWLPARSGPFAWDLVPFAPGDWAAARSDYDVPHRAVLGADAALRGFRVAALYRYDSGSPFTPGFRPGVDANADGSGENDPAFVDGAVSGMEQLLAAWSCLAGQEGRFAERNSCRGPGRHQLDARVALRVARLSGYSAELLIDGHDLLPGPGPLRDAALYLIDDRRELALDGGSGVVTVPLLANPAFGRALRSAEPRLLRIGFRLSH